MPRKSSRLNRSQALTPSQGSLSQTRLEQHFAVSQVDINDQVQNCVRYFVNNAGHNVFFRRADVQKHCNIKQNFQPVIERTATVLKNVYGYNLLVCDAAAGSTKAYVISNALPYKNYNLEGNEPGPRDVQKILLLLILSHIYMSDVAIPEASLHTFLRHFDIDINVRHPLFGNVKEYLNILIRQKFLNVETDPISKKIAYSWGLRSDKEINKQEMLRFVCKMYRDRQIKSWENQYQAACEQGFENDKIREENGVETEEN